MSIMISKAAQYAIRALVHLAGLPPEELTPIRTIAEQEGIPYPFLAKLVGQLVQAKMVESFKGPRGGIRLARPADAINIFEVVHAMDGPEPFEGCFLGLRECGNEDPCPLHDFWKVYREQIKTKLSLTTMAKLSENETSFRSFNSIQKE